MPATGASSEAFERFAAAGVSSRQDGGRRRSQQIIGVVHSESVERLTCEMARWHEAAEDDHELVPDLWVVLGGESVHRRGDDIIEADDGVATALTGEAVHGVVTNISHGISERSGKDVC